MDDVDNVVTVHKIGVSDRSIKNLADAALSVELTRGEVQAILRDELRLLVPRWQREEAKAGAAARDAVVKARIAAEEEMAA